MMLIDDQKNIVLAAVAASSQQWRSAFNTGNAALCAAQYEPTAIMHARPLWHLYRDNRNSSLLGKACC